jgi:peroxiredoxin
VQIFSRDTQYAIHLWIWCFLFVFFACGTPFLIVSDPGTIATDFTLKDQYDTEFRLLQFRGENVLLLGFDKDNISQGETWLDPFLDRYTDSLQILPIANGSGLPFFARLFLKERIKAELRNDRDKSNSSSILLDWDGKVSRQYGMAAKQLTLVLIGRSGRIRLVQPLRQMTEEKIQVVFDLIDQQICQ